MVTVPNGTSARGLEDFTDSRFPQLVQRDVGIGSRAVEITTRLSPYDCDRSTPSNGLAPAGRWRMALVCQKETFSGWEMAYARC